MKILSALMMVITTGSYDTIDISNKDVTIKGSVNVKNLICNSCSITIEKDNSLNMEGSFVLNGNVVNKGSFYAFGLAISKASSFTNHGFVNTRAIYNSASLTNIDGQINTGELFLKPASNVVANSCSRFIIKDLYIEGGDVSGDGQFQITNIHSNGNKINSNSIRVVYNGMSDYLPHVLRINSLQECSPVRVKLEDSFLQFDTGGHKLRKVIVRKNKREIANLTDIIGSYKLKVK